MKKQTLSLLLFAVILLSGCCATKTGTAEPSLYANAWELEYLSGTKIAFDGLYPEKKPFIIFDEQQRQFSGNTSCNGYSGTFTKKENSIRFGDALKTMIFCEGGGEEAYLNMLGKVNKLAFDSEGKLLLLTDDIPMMRFKKIKKTQ